MIPALLSTLVLALGADGPPEAPPGEMPDPTRFSILELQGEYERAVAVYGVRWALIRIAWLWIRCGQPFLEEMGRFQRSTEDEQRSLGHLFFMFNPWISPTGIRLQLRREGEGVVLFQTGEKRGEDQERMLVWQSGHASVDWPGPPEEIRSASASRHPRIGMERVYRWYSPVLRVDRPVRWFRLGRSGWMELPGSVLGAPGEDTLLFSRRDLLVDQIRRWSARWGIPWKL